MGNPILRTALTDEASISGDHSLNEAPLIGKINIRGDSNSLDFINAIESVLGLTPPIEANTCHHSEQSALFWLGPDEWLVHVAIESVDVIMADLQAAFGDMHCAMIEVSDYFSVIELSGQFARSIINSSSPFDIRANHFKTGQCAQTLFGHAAVLIWPVDDKPSFALQVRWSHAKYVYEYLAQSIRNAENLDTFEHR